MTNIARPPDDPLARPEGFGDFYGRWATSAMREHREAALAIHHNKLRSADERIAFWAPAQAYEERAVELHRAWEAGTGSEDAVRQAAELLTAVYERIVREHRARHGR